MIFMFLWGSLHCSLWSNAPGIITLSTHASVSLLVLLPHLEISSLLLFKSCLFSKPNSNPNFFPKLFLFTLPSTFLSLNSHIPSLNNIKKKNTASHYHLIFSVYMCHDSKQTLSLFSKRIVFYFCFSSNSQHWTCHILHSLINIY